MGQKEIESYLNHLAIKRHVSASTQSLALNAIAFLYRQVLKIDMSYLDNFKRLKRQQTIPVVLSAREIRAIFDRMQGTARLMAELVYGTGLRIGECVTLRMKDIDFDNRPTTVRAGKGNIDRVTLFPQTLIPDLRIHLVKVAQLHKSDLLKGKGMDSYPCQMCFM